MGLEQQYFNGNDVNIVQPQLGEYPMPDSGRPMIKNQVKVSSFHSKSQKGKKKRRL